MHLVALLSLHAAIALATAENETLAPYLTDEDFANAHRMAKSPVGKIDDTAMYGSHFEGDILGAAPFVDKSGKFRNAMKYEGSKWSGGRVPYMLAPGHHSVSERAVIAQGMEEIMSKTCIEFVKKEASDKDYIMIFKGRGCFSNIGHVGGEQQLSLGDGCVYMGIAAHELMHALGFFHEQSRTDRNDYITVHFENIEGWAKSNFDSYSTDLITDLGTQYDYGSIMHYPETAFSNNGKRTIVPKQTGVEIGQRRGLSENDAYKINKQYGCKGGSKPNPSKPSKPSKPSSECTPDNYDDCHEVKNRGLCETHWEGCETTCKHNC